VTAGAHQEKLVKAILPYWHNDPYHDNFLRHNDL